MSGQSFPQDVVAGTQLVIPSIHSPNYVTNVSGWTINLDGSAEFNNLTIRGTFSGTNFIVNSSGAFFYSPSEAFGNLIVSIASAAGTDSFGNAYPQGINVTTGTISGTTISGGTISGTTISGTTFNGSNFVFNASGAFFYSGTPASGNLISSITNASGTDSHGNTYLEGVTSYFFTGSDYTAANMDGGIIQWFRSPSAGGTYTLYSNIGFSWNSINGGSLLLQAGNQVQIGQAGNLVWNEINQQLQVPAGDLVATVSSTPETWHNMPGMSSGWSVGTGFAKYRLTAEGFLAFSFNINSPSTKTDGTTIWATGSLPAAYRPQTASLRWPVSTSAAANSANNTPMIIFQTDGSITITGVNSTGALTTVHAHGVLPLV